MIDLEKYLPKKGGFDLKKILVPPGKEVDLEKDFETGYTGAYKDKKEAEVDLAANVLRLADQQDLLFANDTYSLLIVFQALDAAGKDGDRKSTRLNSSHANISYAVFCLKKKKTT